MSNKPTLVEAISNRIDERLRGLHVGMPGRVVTYDKSTQRASVQPLIKRIYTDEEGSRQVEELPILEDVPVIFMRSGGYSITMPLSKGDGVWLSFSDFSLDKWLKHGGLVDPLYENSHQLEDAVCFAGLDHGATDQVAADAIVIAGDIKLGSKDASDPVALKSDLDDLADILDTATTTPQDGGASLLTQMKTWAISGSSKVKAE